MSTTEPVEVIAEPWDEFDAPPSVVQSLPGTAPIVPKDSIAGRSLVMVIAIMTFLASITMGAVMLLRAAAGDWQADLAREVTIQIHRGNVMKKMGAESLAELVRMAGMLEIPMTHSRRAH